MVTKENYFSKENQKKYMGATQYKTFAECPARAMAEINGEWTRKESQALLQGQYLDALFEGEEATQLFEIQNGKKLRQKNGTLYKHFQDCVDAYNRIMEDPVLKRYATGEQQVIMTGVIQGVPFKIAIDSLLIKEAIVDRKYMRNFKDGWIDGERVSFDKVWGYHIQAAIYQKIYEQNTELKLPFYIAGVTKDSVDSRGLKTGVIEKGLFKYSQETLDDTLEEVKASVEVFQEIKEGKRKAYRCEECAYCQETKMIEESEVIIL